MKNKKGFTLIELLGVLVLLAVIALISFIVIDKNLKSNKEKMYNTQIETIELAAKNWGTDHLDALPTEAHQMAVTLNTLKIGGYIDNNISNPINGKCFANTTKVNIINNQNVYKYEIDDDSINFADNCDIFIAETPTVDITVSTYNIGINMNGYFVITSNYPFVTDNKDYITFNRHCYTEESICESGNPSKITSVSEPLPLPNGYEIIVEFQSGDFDEYVFLNVAEGISKNDNKNSIEVQSGWILVDNNAPEAELIEAKSFGSLYSGFPSSDGFWYYNMSGFASVPDGITSIKLSPTGYKIVFKLENVYIVNRIIGTEKEEIFNYEEQKLQNELLEKYGLSDFDKSIVVDILIENQTVEYEFCDANENCTKEFTLPSNPPSENFHINKYNKLEDIKDTKITNRYHDYGRPFQTFDLDDPFIGDESLTLLFTDDRSGVSNACAFIKSSYSTTDLGYLQYLYNAYYSDTYYSDVSAVCRGEALNDKYYYSSTYPYETVQKVIDDAKSYANSYGNALYLWFAVEDNADNVSFYSVPLNNGSSTIPDWYEEQLSGTKCDALCQMQNNSEEWWDIYNNPHLSDETKASAMLDLHLNNQYLCTQVDNCGNFDIDTGYWMTQDGNDPLYTLD